MNAQLLASFIISWLVKPAILLLIVGIVWWLLRKRSASLQHFVLSIGVIGVFFLALMALGLSDNNSTFVFGFIPSLQLPITWLDGLNNWLQQHSSAREALWVMAIYLLPACTIFFYLVLGVIGLWWQTRHAECVRAHELNTQLKTLCELLDIKRTVKLVTVRELDSPQTWGFFRPVIMLPRASLVWDEDKQLSVLIHELGHIARWDWMTQLLVKISCACFWFLLPIWWFARQIYQQAEIACDDYVFKLRDKHLIYAQNLLSIANSSASNYATESLQMRGQSPVYQRIMALLDKQRPHQTVTTETAQYWIICSALLLMLGASVQLLPWREQLRERNHFLLNIQFPVDEQMDSEPLVSTVVEPFSWELLQRIKPSVDQYPEWDDRLEITRVHVAKPARQDLQTDIQLAKTQLDVPQIHIQGYLPIDLVTPEYPAIALQKGIEGWVQVEFSIGLQGEIMDARIVSHAPSRVFDRAVMNALKKSRYRPQILDGQAVIVQGVREMFYFQLISADSPPPRR